MATATSSSRCGVPVPGVIEDQAVEPDPGARHGRRDVEVLIMDHEVHLSKAAKSTDGARGTVQRNGGDRAGNGVAAVAHSNRPLTLAQVASLQRLIGNAAVARLLHPPLGLGAPRALARQAAPDGGVDQGQVRAVEWSHGSMAAVLRDLDTLPPPELQKVEAHSKDAGVDVQRIRVMLSAVHLRKAGGARDWQLRDLYREMQAISMPENQQQEVATFVGAFGLFTPQVIHEYVKDVGDIFSNWNDLPTVKQRASIFGYLVNRQLGIQNVPPCAIVVADIDPGGTFSKDDWTITIASRLGRLDLKPEEQSDFISRAASNFMHEARHAEQIFTIARARAGEGSNAPEIARELGIPNNIAVNADRVKVLPGSPEASAAASWYASEFGAGKKHRDQVLGDLPRRYWEYKELPEEADAHALGVATLDSIKGGASVNPSDLDGGAPAGVQRLSSRICP